MRRGRPYQEFEYEFLGGNRSVWYPVYRSFFLAKPLMLYVRTEGDTEKLWLRSGRVNLDGVAQTWTYAKTPCRPPEFLEATKSVVAFGHWRENDPPEEKYRFLGFTSPQP
jgi:hypothetical protein